MTFSIASMVCVSTALAQAQDPRISQARKDCLTGKVESGVALLAEVFVQTKNANLVYNQARCFEQNGRAEEAILRFREYLRLGEYTAAEKADVEKHIADCRAMKAEQLATSARPPAPTPAPTPANAPPTPPAPATDPTLVGDSVMKAPVEQQPPPGARTRLVGAIIGGAGVAALVTGGIFSYMVSSAKQEAEENAAQKRYDASLSSRGQSYETLQWVFYGTGAALLATGATLYAVGTIRGARNTPVALVPAIAPNQGGVLLQGSF